MKPGERNRKEFIGGSDISAVMGLSQWVTPLRLWAEKTGKIPERDLSDNETVQVGTDLEQYVAERFTKKTDLKVRRDERDFTHPEFPYMRAHIDRWIVGEDALLECKTTSAYNLHKWLGEDMPREYILQVNWYCGIVKKSIGYVACLIGGQRFAWKKIVFDAVLFEKQVAAAREFWENNVANDIPPVAMAEDSETMSELYPDSDSSSRTFEGEDMEKLNNLIDERQGGIEQLKIIEAEVEGLKNQIKQYMGEAEIGSTNRFTITLKKQRVAPFIDTERLKEDGVYEKYEVFNEARVLRTKLHKS